MYYEISYEIPLRDLYIIHNKHLTSRRDFVIIIIQSSNSLLDLWTITTHHQFGTTRFHVMISTRIIHAICKIHTSSMRNTHEIHATTHNLHIHIMHKVRDLCTYVHTSWSAYHNHIVWQGVQEYSLSGRFFVLKLYFLLYHIFGSRSIH